MMSDLQDRVQVTIDRLVESGSEVGVQVAVYGHGELLVDAVAGTADPQTARPVTSDTLFYSTSVGKGVTATVAHVLVERGLFEYDTRVAELWPEFAVNGKDQITVGHVLSHTAGIPGVPADLTPEDLCDWAKMCALIADATPWWEPGTKVGYHALTFGYLVGEVVRRSTGKAISEVLREQVAGPLGVANELFFGVPRADLGRVAHLEEAPGNVELRASLPPDLPMFKAVPFAVLPSAEFGNRADVLTSDIPAGGTMTARAVARMYAALLDEVDGVRLIPAERLPELTTVQVADVDQVVGFPTARTLGFTPGRPGPNPQANPTAFGMPGSGGTVAYTDTATALSFALTKNVVSAGEFSSADRVADVIDEVLGQ